MDATKLAAALAATILIATSSFVAGRCTVAAEPADTAETGVSPQPQVMHPEGVTLILDALTPPSTTTTTTSIPVTVPESRQTAHAAPTVENWERLAHCESRGNWAANTGNGYYGGLQFTHQTWLGYHGDEFANYPHEATREQQIIVAERLHAKRGWQPWPGCTRSFGWR